MKLKLIFILVIFLKLLLIKVNAGIIFSEIFPNTTDDKNLEYIELYNSGNLDLSLSGFILKDKSEKEYLFSSGNILLSNKKKKFFRIETKITLNNSDEELFLYDNFGNLIDFFSYTESIKSEPILLLNNESTNIVDENININDFENNNIKLEKIIHLFQSPTYLTDKDEYKSIYNCDKTKEECRVNLDFRESFFGDINSSDYECRVLLGNINLGGTDTCNPLTVTIPEGIYEIKILIINKSNSLDIQKKILTFVNKKYKKNGLHKNKNENENEGIKSVIIYKPKIIIQSGLNNKNECSNKNNCSINFKYNIKSKFEKCRWDFGLGEYEVGINTKCNPGKVKYGTGEFIVKLRVFEKGDYFNYKESKLMFSNIVKEKINLDNNFKKNEEQKNIKSLSGITLVEKNIKNIEIEKNVIENIIQEEEINKVKSIITLQGKIGKNKEVNENSITCTNICNINFDGSLSSGKISRYSWDFGNGERFEGKNPGYIKYDKFGKYSVYLLTEGIKGEKNIETFLVNFVENLKIKEKIVKKIDSDLNIGIIEKVNANDTEKSKEVDSNSSKNYTFLLYILIFIFSLILIILILKKEKLM